MILRLAHVELGVTDLEQAREFYVDLLGFQVYLHDGQSLYLRAVEEFDVWSLKLTQTSSAGVLHMAFRVDTPDELERLTAVHRTAELPYRMVSAGVEPAQGPALRVYSPDGHPVEFFHKFDEVNVYEPDGRVRLPMRSTHMQHGLPPQRIDHVNLRVIDPEASLAYWRDRLAFSVSEYYVDALGRPSIAWMRRNTGSHDVAIGRYPRAAMHHVAYLVDNPLAVMRAADLMADARLPHRIDFGPGRHGVSNAFYCYVRDPAGNRIEIFASDYQRDLDRPPIRWSLTDYENQGLVWWTQEVPARFREVTSILPGDWA